MSFPDNKIIIGPEDVILEMDKHVMGDEEGLKGLCMWWWLESREEGDWGSSDNDSDSGAEEK